MQMQLCGILRCRGDGDDNNNNNNKRETRDISIEHLYKMFVMHAPRYQILLRPSLLDHRSAASATAPRSSWSDCQPPPPPHSHWMGPLYKKRAQMNTHATASNPLRFIVISGRQTAPSATKKKSMKSRRQATGALRMISSLTPRPAVTSLNNNTAKSSSRRRRRRRSIK